MSDTHFLAVYTEELQKAVTAYPAEYPWAHSPTVITGNAGNSVLPQKTVTEVAAKMMDAIRKNSFNKDGRALKATCKRLGIKYTYAAIREYVSGLEYVQDDTRCDGCGSFICLCDI